MGDAEQNQAEETEVETPEPKEEEKPPEEKPPEEKTEDTEPEEKTEEETDPEAETEPKPEAKAAAEEKHKRAGGWQRRIERQDRAIAEKDQVIQQLTQKLLGGAKEPDKPKDAQEEVRNYFRQEAKQVLEEERAQEKQKQAATEFQRRTQEVRAAHPDYDDVLESVNHIGIPNELRHTLFTSEHGPAIMFQLASNPEELARISALPPLDAAREIGRLEAKASSTPSPKTPLKSAARPPVPPTTVSGNKKPTGNLDDLSLSDYKRAYRSGRR